MRSFFQRHAEKGIIPSMQKSAFIVFSFLVLYFVIKLNNDLKNLMYLTAGALSFEYIAFSLFTTASYFIIKKSIPLQILYAFLWSIYFFMYAGCFQFGDSGYYEAFIYNSFGRSIGSEYLTIPVFNHLLYFFGFNLKGITLTLSFLGGIYIFFLIKLAEQNSNDKFISTIQFCMFVASGMTLTFFRDGENYTLVTVTSIVLIYCLRFNKGGILIRNFLLALAISLHYISLLLIPLYLFTLYRTQKKGLLLNIVILTSFCICFDFFFRPTPFNFGNLPLIGNGNFVDFLSKEVTLYSYFMERMQMLFFVSPSWIIGAILLGINIKNKSTLSLSSVFQMFPFLLFLLFFKFLLGVYNDYSLYTLSGLGLVFFFSDATKTGLQRLQTKKIKYIILTAVLLFNLITFKIIKYRSDNHYTDWDHLRSTEISVYTSSRSG